MSAPARRRCFLALWPPAALATGLTRLAESLTGGRQQHPADLHLTLHFLGDLSEEQLDCVAALVDAARPELFDLVLDRVGYWPRPRVFWVGVTVTPEPLRALVEDLGIGVRACGLRVEEREYRPHVTLRRGLREPRLPELSPLPWRVDRLVLAGSAPGRSEPGAPRYRAIREWHLRRISD